jgi:hypothetical protein
VKGDGGDGPEAEGGVEGPGWPVVGCDVKCMEERKEMRRRRKNEKDMLLKFSVSWCVTCEVIDMHALYLSSLTRSFPSWVSFYILVIVSFQY